MTLQEVLQNIANSRLSNPIVAAQNARNASMEREAQLANLEAAKQRIAANRSEIGNTLGRDVNIFNPKDLEIARGLMQVREGGVDTGLIQKAREELKNPFISDDDRMKNDLSIYNEKQKMNSVDTSILDDIVSGKPIDWSGLAKGRAYLTQEQAKEAIQPHEEAIRQANAAGRMLVTATNKDEGRAEKVQRANKEAFDIVSEITPGIPDFGDKKHNDFRNSIRTSALSFINDPKIKDAYYRQLKSDVSRVINGKAQTYKISPDKVKDEIDALNKIIDEEYSR